MVVLTNPTAEITLPIVMDFICQSKFKSPGKQLNLITTISPYAQENSGQSVDARLEYFILKIKFHELHSLALPNLE